MLIFITHFPLKVAVSDLFLVYFNFFISSNLNSRGLKEPNGTYSRQMCTKSRKPKKNHTNDQNNVD